jgi:RNA polymerase sigma factor for flagellar operon FliA
MERSSRQPDPRETQWWAAWRATGDDSARNNLIAAHLTYARIVAAMLFARRPHDDVEFEDYLQFARLGLLEAIDRYDPSLGAPFRSFASQRVRGAVLDGVSRLTERQQQMAVRRRVLAERTTSLSEQRTADETETMEAAPASLAGSALFDYLAQVGVGLALGFMLEDSGMLETGDRPSARSDPHYQALELKQTRAQLAGLVDQLPPAERRVIALHYQQGHAFDDIARELSLTKGRISQIHKCALGNLRELLAKRQDCDRAF